MKRITVNINFRDAYEEGSHPRDSGGQFTRHANLGEAKAHAKQLREAGHEGVKIMKHEQHVPVTQPIGPGKGITGSRRVVQYHVHHGTPPKTPTHDCGCAKCREKRVR